MQVRKVILLFGIFNASLYSALLPLWEGFDEAFHYSYIETLWKTARLPVLGQTPVTNDVWQSFDFAPVSFGVHAQIPKTTTFKEWTLLGDSVKQTRRIQLDRVRSVGEGEGTNYEAQQMPLAYAALAPVDWLESSAPITRRVLWLRLAAAVIGTILVYSGAARLFSTLEIPEQFGNAALLTIFCSQMLYATIAHVANDWLAVGASALFISSIADFAKRPNNRSALRTGLWLTVGLMSKAYFLAFVLLACGVAAEAIWSRRIRVKSLAPAAVLVVILAMPWYARNITLYGNVGGTQEALRGIGWRQAIDTAPKIDWLAAAGQLARASLWTGNNTYFNFSRATLNLMLAVLFIAILGWAIRFRVIRPAERIVGAAVVIFSVALAYATSVSYVMTQGDMAAASPWYSQALLVPVITVAYLGMYRWKRLGCILAAFNLILWGWVLIATWVVKLFPMYSGMSLTAMHAHELWTWYASGAAAAHARDLSLLALAPAQVLYALLAVSLMATVSLVAIVVRDLLACQRPWSTMGSV